ncbi:hypothetical protein [Chondrinema litorale]|nr:hypothetical protein [Chondrinema litorale]UZR94665.1 hypothetical protein OQ292_02385 [Chondrinema litorale]
MDSEQKLSNNYQPKVNLQELEEKLDLLKNNLNQIKKRTVALAKKNKMII